MASSSAGEHAAIGEAEAAPVHGKKSRRRISDILGDSDGGDAAASPPPFPPDTAPQLRLPRFTCARFRFAGFGRKRRGGRKEASVASKTEDAPSPDSSSSAGAIAVAAGSIKQQQPETSTSSGGGGVSGEAAGTGLSMLLLLAARTCVELHRMAELRAQMEALVKEIRDETSRVKIVTPSTTTRTFNLQLSSATVSSSSCTSDTDTNRHPHATTCNAVEIVRQEAEGEPAGDDEEAEFEAEQAQHRPTLECYTDQDTSDESSDDEFIELDDGGRFGGDLGLRWDDAGDEDRDDEEGPSSGSGAQHYCGVESAAGAQDGESGVRAIELERALHELLHRRDAERIEELESALRRAEQRLREKEMEARLWQDTATLALQPPTVQDASGQ